MPASALLRVGARAEWCACSSSSFCSSGALDCAYRVAAAPCAERRRGGGVRGILLPARDLVMDSAAVDRPSMLACGWTRGFMAATIVARSSRARLPRVPVIEEACCSARSLRVRVEAAACFSSTFCCTQSRLPGLDSLSRTDPETLLAPLLGTGCRCFSWSDESAE